MNEEELDGIQELIERKLLMAEVMGGLTSQDKKFINLWNYAIQLQNNWNELKKWLEETIKQYDNVGLKFKKESNFECASRSYDYLKQYQTMLDKMQKLQGDDKN